MIDYIAAYRYDDRLGLLKPLVLSMRRFEDFGFYARDYEYADSLVTSMVPSGDEPIPLCILDIDSMNCIIGMYIEESEDRTTGLA